MSSSSGGHDGVRWLWVSLLVIALDQISKAVIVSKLHLFDSIHVLPVFNIVLYHNAGAAFSFLANQPGWQRWFFVVLGVSISTGIVIWMWRLPENGPRWIAAGLALVTGGAMGNVVDRIWRGYVIDFIEVHYHQWFFPAFNIADSAITLGAAILILFGLSSSGKRAQQ